MQTSADQRYLETSIATAAKEDLIIKIFDILILSSQQALEKLDSEPGEIECIHRCLLRAQRACCLLMGSLDMQIGGELAHNLFRIYEFWHHELVMTNMRKDASRLAQILPAILDFRDTWQQAITKFKLMQRQNTAVGSAAADQRMSSFAAVG